MAKRAPGPDRTEKGLRLGCGTLLGLLLAAPLALRLSGVAPAWLWVALVSVVFLCAYGALRLGDAFWERFFSRVWWWWQ